MDFVQRSYAQLRDLFLSMTPAARVTASLMLVVVIVSIGYLFKTGTSGPDAYLFGGEFMPASQLNQINAALAQGGMKGYEIEGNRIKVPRGREPEYMAKIAEGGAMPPNYHEILEKAISGSSLLGSREERLQRTKAAREQQLSLIIGRMQGVEEAYVMFNEKQVRRGLSPGMKDSLVTATVSINASTGDSIDASQARMIKKLVANGIGGLPENIVVSNMSGAPISGGDFGGVDGADSEYYHNLFMIEKQMKNKIMNDVVGVIPGVLVAVSAEIDSMIEEIVTDIKLADKPTSLSTSSSEETSSNKKPISTGTVGLSSNSAIGPNGIPNGSTATAGNRLNESATSSTVETTNNVVGQTQTRTKKKGHTPTSFAVTIKIPSDYWKMLWKERNKINPDAEEGEPTEDDLKKVRETEYIVIQEEIAQLLKADLKEGENPYPAVVVSTYQSLPAKVFEQPGMASDAMAWTGQNWSTLGMMGLAFFSLIMLRSMVKAVPTPDATDEAASAFQIEDEDEDEDDGDPNRPRLRLKKGSNMKDDLADMVRDDPDAAASILRSWISNAG